MDFSSFLINTNRPLIGDLTFNTVEQIEEFVQFSLSKQVYTGIYVSIGGSTTIKPSPSSDQQYPALLKKWKSLDKMHSQLIIIIIDPELEKFPPAEPFYVEMNTLLPRTKNGNYFLGQLNISWNYDPTFNNVYHNYTDNVHIISIAASYFDFSKNYIDFSKPTIDGTILLPFLNHHAMVNDWFLYVNNYTGSDIQNIAEWCKTIQPELHEHTSHIIYGDCCQKSECLPDITSFQLNYPLMQRENGKVYIFNAIENTKYDLISLKYLREQDDFSKKDREIINKHVEYYLYDIRSYISMLINIIRASRVNLLKEGNPIEKMNFMISMNSHNLDHLNYTVFSTEYKNAVSTGNFEALIMLFAKIVKNKLISAFSILRLVNEQKTDLIENFISRLLIDQIDYLPNIVKNEYDSLISKGYSEFLEETI